MASADGTVFRKRWHRRHFLVALATLLVVSGILIWRWKPRPIPPEGVILLRSSVGVEDPRSAGNRFEYVHPDGTGLTCYAKDDNEAVRTHGESLMNPEMPDISHAGTGKEDVSEAVTSPDGKTVCLNINDTLYLADANRQNRRLIVHDAQYPAFSPAGNAILYRSTAPKTNGTYMLATLSGWLKRPLCSKLESIINPIFSPDGTHVLFSAFDLHGKDALYLINTNGWGLRRLVGAGRLEYYAFSPGGTSIAYSTDDGIFRLRLSDLAVTKLLPPIGDVIGWSPTVPVPAHAINEPTLPWQPPYYASMNQLTADIDGDGRKELVYDSYPLANSEGAPENTPSYLVVARGKDILAKITAISPNVIRFQAIDLTGNGHPALCWVTESVGGSAEDYRVYLFQWQKSKLVSLLKDEDGQPLLDHDNLGGCLLKQDSPHTPVQIIRYSWHFGTEHLESHYSQHRYHFDTYTLQNGIFERTAQRDTTHYYDCGKDALAEMHLAQPKDRRLRLYIEL